MRLIFLFGNNGREIYEKEKDNDDLLIGDFNDSFHNLTMKDSMLYTWARQKCKVSYIFKGKESLLRTVGEYSVKSRLTHISVKSPHSPATYSN